jgi:hypothetical protein
MMRIETLEIKRPETNKLKTLWSNVVEKLELESPKHKFKCIYFLLK